MGKLRGFEVVSKFKDNEYVQIPKRGTEDSAGYDFVTIEDVVIPSIMENASLSQELESYINQVYSEGVPKDTTEDKVIGEFVESIEKEQVKATLVKTGIKAYMQKGEVLKLYIRSSMAAKKGLALANATAIIDADYHNNENNEGHIMVSLINFSALPVFIPAGTRIAQGIFESYLVADGDNAQGVRTGGFGSTGESSVS